MASLIAAQMDPDPNDRPTWVVGLTYLASTLLGAGGLFSVNVGATDPSFHTFGLLRGFLGSRGNPGLRCRPQHYRSRNGGLVAAQNRTGDR